MLGWRASLELTCYSSMYSAQLLDHFEHPRNAGDLTDATACVQVENPACGDILELAVTVEGNYISQIRFRAKGCVPAMACGSLITEMVVGRDILEAGRIRSNSIIEAIGGLPPASGHAAELAVDALRAALRKIASNE